MARTSDACVVEDQLGREASLELDIFLADPSQWPKAIFDGWKLPPGPIPSSFRQWGATKIGLEWCRSRGHEFTAQQMTRHYQRHVPIVPYTPSDFAAKGVATGNNTHPLPVPQDPISYMDVYKNGLRVGNKALDLLQQRVEAMIEAGDLPDTKLLMKLADLGVKLATSQASILARGSSMTNDKDDDIEGFRSGSAPLPSQRMGHSRIRVVDGEARPVHDTGPSDRAKFNERSREEGGPELPSPLA